MGLFEGIIADRSKERGLFADIIEDRGEGRDFPREPLPELTQPSPIQEIQTGDPGAQGTAAG